MKNYKFNTIVQQEHQSFDSFYIRLKMQADQCEFKCTNCQTSYANRLFKDRSVIGAHHKTVQERLLRDSNVTTDKIKGFRKSIEISKQQFKALHPEEQVVLVKAKRSQIQSQVLIQSSKSAFQKKVCKTSKQKSLCCYALK